MKLKIATAYEPKVKSGELPEGVFLLDKLILGNSIELRILKVERDSIEHPTDKTRIPMYKLTIYIPVLELTAEWWLSTKQFERAKLLMDKVQRVKLIKYELKTYVWYEPRRVKRVLKPRK